MPSENPPSPQTLTLRLKRELDSSLDGSSIQPNLIGLQSRADVAALRLTGERTAYRLDEIFEIIGDPSDQIVVHGDCRLIDRLGAGMKSGMMTVMGNVGDESGADLGGGRLEIFGNAGQRIGMGMRRGQLTVHGSVGDRACGPAVGSTKGMSGGDCCILGNAGHRAGERMRRGTLFIQGNAGDYGAAQMIAGTIIILGRIGKHWAQGMKRGSIIVSQEQPDSFDASLTSAREFELSFLPLLWKHLASHLSDPNLRLPQSRWAYRQIGDRANNGVGEVLTLHRHDL